MNEKGSALIAALITLLVISFVSAALMQHQIYSLHIAQAAKDRVLAVSASEIGSKRAQKIISQYRPIDFNSITLPACLNSSNSFENCSGNVETDYCSNFDSKFIHNVSIGGKNYQYVTQIIGWNSRSSTLIVETLGCGRDIARSLSYFIIQVPQGGKDPDCGYEQGGHSASKSGEGICRKGPPPRPVLF